MINRDENPEYINSFLDYSYFCISFIILFFSNSPF